MASRLAAIGKSKRDLARVIEHDVATLYRWLSQPKRPARVMVVDGGIAALATKATVVAESVNRPASARSAPRPAPSAERCADVLARLERDVADLAAIMREDSEGEGPGRLDGGRP